MRKLLIAISLMAGSAAMAQAPQQRPVAAGADGPEIVIKGKRNLERQVNDFVRALNDTRSRDQISRFEWAVCPNVIGLSNEHNVRASVRMRAVAMEAGIKVGKRGCKGNVLLAVTDHKAKFIKWLKAEHPTYFEGLSSKEAQLMADESNPVAAWHVQGLLDSDGIPVPYDRVSGQYTVERTDTPSRISTTTRPNFTAAIVVVDNKAIDGLTVAQLADYAAMRAYAQVDPARVAKSAAPTILSVVDAPIGSSVPITLTEWDLAYLKALYGSAEHRLAGQQSEEMKRLMAQELGRQAPGQR